MTKIRNQPRIPGLTRIPTGSSLPTRVREAVEREAKHFRCSKSWIIVVAAAHALGVQLSPEEEYVTISVAEKPQRKKAG